MEELAKSDLFFFLTGGAVIIITVVVLVILFYIIKILKDIGDIAGTVKEESGEIISDIHNFRESIKKGGKKIKDIINPKPKKKKGEAKNKK